MKTSSFPPVPVSESRLNRSIANPTAICALTAGAGGLTLSQAAIVQIDINQVYSTASPGALNRDLTGDGVEDISTWNLRTYTGRTTTGFLSYYVSYHVLALRGTSGGATAGFLKFSTGSGSTLSSYFFAAVSDSFNRTYTSGSGSTVQSRNGFVEIRFTDSRINNGAETCGFVHLRARNIAVDEQEITVIRLVFDDSDTNCPNADPATNYPPFAIFQDSADPRIGVLQKEVKQLKKKLRKALAKAKRAGVRNTSKPGTLFRQLKPVDAKLAREIKKLQKKIRKKEALLASLGG